MSERGKKWFRENKEAAAERQRARQQTEAYKQRIKDYRAAYYVANREKWVDYSKSWAQKQRQTPERYARMMLTWTRTRARRKGIEFDLTSQFLTELLLAGHCAVTGLPFDVERSGDGKKGMKPFAPSVDRIDPKLGYVKSNVRIVCYIYNCAKSEFHDEDVMTMASAMLKR